MQRLTRINRPTMIVVLAAVFVLLASDACAAPPATPTVDSTSDVTFVIPAGTEAALERGEPAFQFPDQIQLSAGQSVVITNQDYAMHYFFDIPVAPGRTIRKFFARPGSFVYQGGLSCSISRSNSISVRVQ